jgi:small subunit ribosomal protein S20
MGCKNKLAKLYVTMANIKSAKKRIRNSETKRLRNRYQHKTTRTAIKRLKSATDKSAAAALLNQVASMLDKLAKNNIIHKNKAANLKGKLTRHVAALA